jgi:multicomponent Na+:H+ antiporter subunit D
MNPFAEIHPALILLVGALFVPFFRGVWRSAWTILLPVLALAAVAALPSPGEGAQWTGWTLRVLPWVNEPLTFLRVDGLSKAFAYIFTINAIAAFVFAFYVKQSGQHVASLIYIGAALGAVFAGDLVSLYVFWEVMAVASTFVILARRTEKAKGSAYRYVLIHLLGGLFFLAGLAITVAQTGSIAFDGFDFATAQNAGTWLILLGFLVNAAAPPFSAWLSDAYPEASVTGGLILSAYTTKTAVYALLRGYEGWEPLIWVGCIMSIYGIIYALLENDMRRILAYSDHQPGRVHGLRRRIGGPIAISGATAHAFCHIIYKSLLWMSAGAVLYRVGKSKCTDLGGLYKTMPWTLTFGTIGALAISAVPLTSGFTSKTIILHAAEHEHLFWPWLILEAASAGVFLHAGSSSPTSSSSTRTVGCVRKRPLCRCSSRWGPLLPLPFPRDPPAAALRHPPLSRRLQRLDRASRHRPGPVADALGARLLPLLPMLKRTATISLDTDWFYRKGGDAFYRLADKSLNAINAATSRLFLGKVVNSITNFFESGLPRLACFFMTPLWKVMGHDTAQIEEERHALFRRAKIGAFPISITAFCAVILLGLLTAYYYVAGRW